jgi:spermidine/putrescine-binding protein
LSLIGQGRRYPGGMPVRHVRPGSSQILRTSAVILALALTACSGHDSDTPARKHAKAACAHWSKLNVGIADKTQRQQESEAFQREATEAAKGDAKYKPLQAAAESWTFAQGSSSSIENIDALRSAIEQARAACAGVPTK